MGGYSPPAPLILMPVHARDYCSQLQGKYMLDTESEWEYWRTLAKGMLPLGNNFTPIIMTLYQ